MIISDNRPEVLAPAGSPEQLAAAVRSGADAVYLGAGSMNARQSAKNFTHDQLVEAAAYCREYGVKLYVAMNTLLFDDELEQARELFETVCALPADGVIVQDLGLAMLMKQAAPDMHLHASTQMTVHNPAALPVLKDMGFTRAVVARELSGAEIEKMAENAPVELEAFVHGALCMCVSGQCYFSAMLGGRSGNRGRCAQPCRLPFRSGSSEYALSLKDMSHVEHIDRLARAGVRSLKIEGRMKRPEYCAAATAVCGAKARGEEVPSGLAGDLSAIFSRSGFTDGYFTARRGAAMFGHRTKDDVTAADGSVYASLHELYKKERGRIPVDMTIEVRRGKPVTLEARDSDGHSVKVTGEPPLESDGGSISAQQLSARLAKTGGTAFVPGDIQCAIDDGLFMPASAVNALRRDALAELTGQRRECEPISCSWLTPRIESHTAAQTELHAVFSHIGQIPENLPENVSRIYVPFECGRENLLRLRESLKAEVCVEAPRGLFGNEDKIRALLAEAAQCGIKTCMIHNIGIIEPVLSAGLVPYGGFGLNVTNSCSIEQLEKLGITGCELSFELTLNRIASLGGDIPRGVIVYGHLPLMLTRNCPSALGGCPGTPDGCAITDRKGNSFATRCRMGCTEIFNCVPLDMTGRIREISGAEHHIMRFTVEDADAVGNILRSYRHGGAVSGAVTRGLYYRGVE